MEVKKKAYAKINLTLDLTGVLPDGYHGIFTCMQSVGMYDTVIVKENSGGINLSCSEKYIPCDSRNTAYKAAQYFLDSAEIKGGADIFIKKIIPSGAGLAGGSADAGAVLRALDEIYPGRLSEKQLLSIALNVGADVPFCFTGGTRLCQNIGEIMSPLPDFFSHVLIVKPRERVSTKEAYKKFDTAEKIQHPDNQSYLFYAASGDYKKASEYAFNIFENLCDIKSGDRIKRTMLEKGAYYSAMSGSGSAYFGLFNSEKEAERCAEILKPGNEKVFVCKTVNKGVE